MFRIAVAVVRPSTEAVERSRVIPSITSPSDFHEKEHILGLARSLEALFPNPSLVRELLKPEPVRNVGHGGNYHQLRKGENFVFTLIQIHF